MELLELMKKRRSIRLYQEKQIQRHDMEKIMEAGIYTIWGLIVPNLMVNAYYVMLMRTFFETTIPFALIDAAKVDGAGEFKIFYSVVLPLTKPILATVGLFAGIAYWNDWYNGMVYLTDSRLFSVQNILNRMITDIQFLSSNANLAGNVGSVGGGQFPALPHVWQLQSWECFRSLSYIRLYRRIL